MKIALLADLHFGIKKSDIIFQNSQLKFYELQFVKELKEQNIDTIVVCGDIFDTRQSINVQTENVVLNLFKNTLKDFTCHIIVGNHDMFHTNTTEVNSLKSLDLLPNCTVYEKPTEVVLGNEKVLMLPWITNYMDFDGMILNHYNYCFAHLDIVGFDMGNGMLCSNGLTVKNLISHFTHTYTGHYHCRINKTFMDGTVTYIGSPYQLTRIDRRAERGYGVLDLDNEDFVWKNNNKSMKFLEFVYPDVDKSKITNNVIDLKIPFELQNETKKIYDLVQELELLNPAYPVNIFNMEKETVAGEDIDIDTNNFNLINLIPSFIEQLETDLPKKELVDELINLYNQHKGNDV